MLKCVLQSCCLKWQHAWKPTKLNISGLIEGPEYSNSWWKAVRLEHVYKCQCQCQWYLVDRINSSLLSSISDSWWQRFRLCQPEQPEQSSIKNQSMPMPCACGTTTILSWLQWQVQEYTEGSDEHPRPSVRMAPRLNFLFVPSHIQTIRDHRTSRKASNPPSIPWSTDANAGKPGISQGRQQRWYSNIFKQ